MLVISSGQLISLQPLKALSPNPRLVLTPPTGRDLEDRCLPHLCNNTHMLSIKVHNVRCSFRDLDPFVTRTTLTPAVQFPTLFNIP